MRRHISKDGSSEALAVVATFFLAIARVQAQQATQPSPAPERKVVVSIPHRKLALVESGKVRKIYPVVVSITAEGAVRVPDERIGEVVDVVVAARAERPGA